MVQANTPNQRIRSLILTLVRHGESTDNIKTIWAGHRDATLTNFGHAQAQRLGEFFKDQSFNRIFCSDLQRAKLTANQIRLQNIRNPVLSTDSIEAKDDKEQDGVKLFKTQLIVEPLIKEQNFGEAEGERWDSGGYSVKDYFTNRSLKFKDGESREDVKSRAQKFVHQVLIPEWLSSIKLKTNGLEPEQQRIVEQEEEEHIHFVIVSHGVFLSELIGVLDHLVNPSIRPSIGPDHFSNTGWTRIKITRNFVQDLPEEYVKFETIKSNQVSHLTGLQRQPGGIGLAPYDPKQSTLNSFVKTVS